MLYEAKNKERRADIIKKKKRDKGKKNESNKDKSR